MKSTDSENIAKRKQNLAVKIKLTKSLKSKATTKHYKYSMRPPSRTRCQSWGVAHQSLFL